MFVVIFYSSNRKPKKKKKIYIYIYINLWSPLNSKEIKPVNSKGNQTWMLIGKTDAEAEAPVLWPPEAWPIWKCQVFGAQPFFFFFWFPIAAVKNYHKHSDLKQCIFIILHFWNSGIQNESHWDKTKAGCIPVSLTFPASGGLPAFHAPGPSSFHK